MPELYPTESELADLSGTSDAEQEVLFIPTGESPYYISFYKMQYRLLDVARRAGDLRVFKDGDLTFGVRAGKYMNGATAVNYAGASAQALTNNQTNYIYLTAAGVLTVNTTGFPAASTPYIPLATIVTSGGEYSHDDIADYRGRAIFQPVSDLTPAEENEAHDFFAATDISGAEAETLTSGSTADALHKHDAAGIADGAITNAKVNASAAVARSKLAQETAVYSIPLDHAKIHDCVNLNLGPAGSTDDLGLPTGTPGTNDPILRTSQVSNNAAAQYARYMFNLPAEYVSGGAVTLRFHARVTVACQVHSKIDAEVWKQGRESTPSADLCATAEQAITASWADKDFTITPTGLGAGNVLDIRVKLNLDDTGGAAGAYGEIGSVQLLLAVKG